MKAYGINSDVKLRRIVEFYRMKCDVMLKQTISCSDTKKFPQRKNGDGEIAKFKYRG